MSERILEVAQRPDGRFWASYDERRPAVEVSNWDDIRAIRARRHLVDHWAGEDRQHFIDQHGHPFDHWWDQLTPECAGALMADPTEPVPADHLDEVKRTLRHEPRQAGLEMHGSWLSAELTAFVTDRARRRPADGESG
jgi:hypothetical protein